MADSFDPYVHWLGVTEARRPVDHYTLLGLPRFEADSSAISSAAQQRIALVSCHTGGPHDAEARRLSAELAAACACLLDPQQKKVYDDSLHLHVGGAPRHVPMQSPLHVAAPPVAKPAPHLPPDRDVPVMQMDEPSAATAEKKGEDADADVEEDAAQTGRRRPAIIVGMLVFALLLFGGITTGLVLVFNRESPPETSTDAATVAAAPSDAGDADDGDQPSTSDGMISADDGSEDGTLPGRVEIIHPTAGGVLEFPAAKAELHGPELRRDTRQSHEVITNWTSRDNWLTWRFDVEKPGVYQVEITYAATSGRGEFELTAEGVKNPLHATLRSQGTDGQMITEETKPIAFADSGMKTLTMRAASIPGDELMTLQSIRMTFDPRFSGERRGTLRP
jgi:hypothetical protein